MNQKLVVVGIAAVLIYLLTRKSGTLSPFGQSAYTSTASPYGSASGILTPVGAPLQPPGLLNGLEAFFGHGGTTQYGSSFTAPAMPSALPSSSPAGPGQTSFQLQETLGPAAVLSEEEATPIYQAGPTVVPPAPDVSQPAGSQPPDLSYLGSTDPTLQVPDVNIIPTDVAPGLCDSCG